MIRLRTLKKGFAHFDAVAVNPRWAWSAQTPDGRTVVLTLWKDQIHHSGNKLKIDVFGDDVHFWKDLPGNRDRIKKLVHARHSCDGLFRAVFVVAKDPKARPRQILYRYIQPTLVMKLTDLDERTGEFSEESVDERR